MTTLQEIIRGLFAALIAIVGIVGAATAPPLSTSTSAPTPATMPVGVILGVGPTAKIATTYTAGMAPCLGWSDSRAFGSVRTDRFPVAWGDGQEWYVPPQYTVDPVAYPISKVGANDGLSGPIAAHWFDRPGTYKAQQAIERAAGPAVPLSWSVVVLPDTRKQLSAPDVATFYKAVQAGNVTIRLTSNQTLVMPSTCIPGPNVAIYGNGATLTPASNSPVFAGAGNGSTTNFFCHGVHFHDAKRAGRLATVRGSNWAFVDCTIGDLSRGFVVSGCDGLLLQGVVQLDSSKVDSQVFYADDVSRLIVNFCQFKQSTNESPFRITAIGDGIGGANGYSLEYSLFAQPALSKAPITTRTLVGGYERHNVVAKGDRSIQAGIGNDAAVIGKNRILDLGIHDMLLASGGVQATCLVGDGTVGLTISNLDARLAAGGSAVTVAPNVGSPSTCTDILLDGMRVSGDQAVAYKISATLPPVAVPASQGGVNSTIYPGLHTAGSIIVNGK